MPPHRYDMWVHGSDVNIEYPDRVDGHERRAGWGTTVVQKDDRNNWFHFAVPTPTVMYQEEERIGDPDELDTSIFAQDLFLKAETNENARVDHVHAWDADERFFTKNDISGLENEQFKVGYDVNREIDFGLCICVHVEGLDNAGPQPEVTFHGAGAKFKHDR